MAVRLATQEHERKGWGDSGGEGRENAPGRSPCSARGCSLAGLPPRIVAGAECSGVPLRGAPAFRGHWVGWTWGLR